MLTPGKESLDCSPSCVIAIFARIVSVPEGIGKTNQSIDKFQPSDESAVFVIERARRRRVCKWTVLFVR